MLGRNVRWWTSPQHCKMAAHRLQNRKDVAKHRNTKRVLLTELKEALGLPNGVTEIVTLKEAMKAIRKVSVRNV